MKAVYLAAALCWTCVGVQSAAAAGQAPTPQPKAFLRVGSDGHYIALVLDPPAARNTTADKVIASLYRNGRLVTQVVGSGDAHGAHFSIPLGDASTFGGNPRGLLVAVTSYPTDDPLRPGGFSAPVTLEVRTSITTDTACRPAIQIAASTEPPTAYETTRLNLIQEYVRAHPAKAESEPRAARGTRTHLFDFADDGLETGSSILDCFVLAPRLPTGVNDLRLTFPDDAPVELRPNLLKTNIAVGAHKSAPFAIDAAPVGKRPLEENLDLGLQFGSSVNKDAAGVATRSKKGSIDIRLAPLLNLFASPSTESNSLWFFTPILFDARVSSGDVTKETLAQNRIVIGSEFEWRHYTNPSTDPTFQRAVFSFRNASDRDFKQAEWKAVGEVHLVFAGLNEPLWLQEGIEPSQLDPAQPLKRIVPVLGFGYQFVPVVGFELGRTWRNELPIASIEKGGAVHRAFVGGNVTFDFTRYVSLSLRELAYVRGEVDADKVRNYFLARLEVPLAGFSATTAQAVFFSYERGGLPPFSTPDVNALKLGYRLLWNGWAQQMR